MDHGRGVRQHHRGVLGGAGGQPPVRAAPPQAGPARPHGGGDRAGLIPPAFPASTRIRKAASGEERSRIPPAPAESPRMKSGRRQGTAMRTTDPDSPSRRTPALGPAAERFLSDPGRGGVGRRLVPVSRPGGLQSVHPGDVAILDRHPAGRSSLVRLANELALRGAVGLVVPNETATLLPPDVRTSVETRIPLLVVDSDWDRAKASLLDLDTG